MRIGVRNRIIIAFTGVIFFTLAAIVMGILMSARFNATLQYTANTTLPALISAEELARESDALVVTATTLAGATNQWDRLAVSDRILDRKKWLEELIQQLRDFNAEPEMLDDISKQQQELLSSFFELDKTVALRIENTKVKDALLETVIKMTGYTALSSINSPENEQSLDQLRHLELTRDIVVQHMLNGLLARDMPSLKKAHGAFTSSLEQFLEAGRIFGQDRTRRFESQYAEIIALGNGSGSVFSVREQELELGQRIWTLLKTHRIMSERLTFALAALVHKLNNEVTARSGDVAEEAKRYTSYMLIIGAFSLLGVAALAAYLATNVARRLEILKHTMHAIAGGDREQHIPRGGNDEISDMADALDSFVEQLNLREDKLKILVNERTTELQHANQQLERELGVRRIIESELKKNEARLRLLAQVSSDWFWEMDKDLKFTYFSKHFYDRTGLSPTEVIGKSYADTISKFAANRHGGSNAKEMMDLLNQHQPIRNFEFSMQIKDADILHILINGVPVFDENDNFTGYHGATTDTTIRVQTEARLQQAQKMQSLGNLAGGIAHTFNNLLLPIQMLSELTRDELAPESAARTRLNRVIEACDRAKTLGQRILLFSRQDEPQKERIDASKITREAIDLLEAGLPSSVQIHKTLTPNTGLIMADRTQIEALIINLGSNAADAIGNASGRITFHLAPVELDETEAGEIPGLQPGAYAMLSVADSGGGIEGEQLNRIFDPFFTTKEVGKGTGLGLSIASGVVSMHHGAITVTSKIGHGTTFKVYLPLLSTVSAIDDIAEPTYDEHDRISNFLLN